jgi:selenocysteine lyase/cysteine desulfurase
MAGTTAAVDVLAGLGGAGDEGATRRERLLASSITLEAYEEELRGLIERGLAGMPGVTVHSRAAVRTPTLLVTFAGRDAADASRHLLERDILAPAGSFYALEASRHLGLGDAGGLRIGLAPYNTVDEVERLLLALEEFARG